MVDDIPDQSLLLPSFERHGPSSNGVSRLLASARTRRRLFFFLPPSLRLSTSPCRCQERRPTSHGSAIRCGLFPACHIMLVPHRGRVGADMDGERSPQHSATSGLCGTAACRRDRTNRPASGLGWVPRARANRQRRTQDPPPRLGSGQPRLTPITAKLNRWDSISSRIRAG